MDNSIVSQVEFWAKKAKEVSEGSQVIKAKDYDNKVNHNEAFIKYMNRDRIGGKEIIKLIEDSSDILKCQLVDIMGTSIDSDFIASIDKKIDLESLTNESREINFSYSIRHSSIRAIPSAIPLFKKANSSYFDRNIESSIYLFDPAIEIFTTKCGEWSFVLTEYYSGWLNRLDLGFCKRTEWKEYMTMDDFLIALESKSIVKSPDYHKTLKLSMGSRLPYKIIDGDYYVSIPTLYRDDSLLTFKYIKLDDMDMFSIGYLESNRENIIRQAFKMINEDYGWGGIGHNRDCSAFVRDIFRCMGIDIHRNASDQWKKSRGKRIQVDNSKSASDINDILKSLLPGAALYMKGHVMLFLGSQQEEYYVIHATASYYEKNQVGDLDEVKAMKVALTPLSIYNSEGEDYIKLLLGAKDFIKSNDDK